jgi:hypothetical protein
MHQAPLASEGTAKSAIDRRDKRRDASHDRSPEIGKGHHGAGYHQASGNRILHHGQSILVGDERQYYFLYFSHTHPFNVQSSGRIDPLLSIFPAAAV